MLSLLITAVFRPELQTFTPPQNPSTDGNDAEKLSFGDKSVRDEMAVELKPERRLVAPRFEWREARGEAATRAAIFEQNVIEVDLI
jgi:hypothetical protein